MTISKQTASTAAVCNCKLCVVVWQGAPVNCDRPTVKPTEMASSECLGLRAQHLSTSIAVTNAS